MVKSKTVGVIIRPALAGDCKRLWQWRNEPTTREASFDVCAISYEEHLVWFANTLAASDRRIFIVTSDSGEEIGYVRFNLRGQEADISVSLDKRSRGKGFGAAAIKMTSDIVLADTEVETVFALVKCNNAGSLSAFGRAGFILGELVDVNGDDAYKLAYK